MMIPSTHALPVKDGPRTPLTFIHRDIPPDRVLRLSEYGQMQGATVNDVLVAAFFRALAAEGDWDGKKQLILTTTVDLRRYLPAGWNKAITNLSGPEYPSLAGLSPNFPRRLCASRYNSDNIC